MTVLSGWLYYTILCKLYQESISRLTSRLFKKSAAIMAASPCFSAGNSATASQSSLNAWFHFSFSVFLFIVPFSFLSALNLWTNRKNKQIDVKNDVNATVAS